jgi:hypothetical protein
MSLQQTVCCTSKLQIQNACIIDPLPFQNLDKIEKECGEAILALNYTLSANYKIWTAVYELMYMVCAGPEVD